MVSGAKERGEYLKDPYHDMRHDPYFLKQKYKEPAVCSSCGVQFRRGIFAWGEGTPRGADSMTCPACMRIADSYEGGIVTLSGIFFGQHHDEIMNLVRHVEELEKGQRPLERIMAIKEQEGSVIITTTYEHLARRIGEAIHRAYKGTLNFTYADSEKHVRVQWER